MSHILPSHEVQCMLFFAILPSPMNYICTTNPFQNATAKYTVLHVVLQKQGKSGDYLARYDCSAFYASVALASAGADSVFSFSFFSSLSFLSLSPLLRCIPIRKRKINNKYTSMIIIQRHSRNTHISDHCRITKHAQKENLERFL